MDNHVTTGSALRKPTTKTGSLGRFLSRAVLVSAICLLAAPSVQAKECVALLHGLARSAASMSKLMIRLSESGYSVENVYYPSRRFDIEKLAPAAVEEGLSRCRTGEAERISFVTHSLGGILVRYYLRDNSIPELHRVVMLGPPNQGSEVVDKLKAFPGFRFVNGPVGTRLGTRDSDLPKSLGPVDFDLGIIAGTKSINLILSSLLPNPDDGKVSVEKTKVDGMSDFLTVPEAHPFLMNNDQAISQVIHFLRFGQFEKAED